MNPACFLPAPNGTRHPPYRPIKPPFLACLLAALFTVAPAAAPGPRGNIDFNPDWRFLKADPAGAEQAGFDDSAWATVSAPHTFNDTDTFDNWSLPGHRGEQEQWSGRTWYRKHFTAPAAWQGKRIFIEFEAVRQVAEVYLNGIKLGTAKGGFTPFGFDLTPHLRIGSANVIAVMADNRFQKDPLPPPPGQAGSPTRPTLAQLSEKLMEQIPDTLEELQADQIPWNNPHWHPAHGGIYRNVRLIVTDPLHITLPLFSFLQTEGPYVYATDIDAASANVHLEVPVRNGRPAEAAVELAIAIIDADGKAVAHRSSQATIPAGTTKKIVIGPTTLANPRLWEPGYPHVYRVTLQLHAHGQVVDTSEIPLGIRKIEWEAASGLWVNGAHYKLHGWGQKSTNEWPGLGAALPDWLQVLTLQLMRDAGGNFVRWGHVPGGPAQIAAADHLGIVTLQPGGDGEHDTKGGAWRLRVENFRDVLVYYRNHPSVFIWEGGNQKVSREHASELRALMDQYDPHGGRAYAHRRADQITAAFMDVGIGTEGGREIASLPVVEGEYNREESPRRVWDDFSPPNFGYPEAKGQTYQLTSEQFAVNQVAHYVNKIGAANHAGGANWIFSDSTSGGRVAVEVARTSGEVDGVRLPKEAYHVTQVMFTSEPRAHIIGHWSYPAGTKKTIYVAANAGGEVELLLNGKSLGRAKPEDKFLYRFPDVTFAAGELQAIACDSANQPRARHSLHTTGPATALRLTPIVSPAGWRADGADVALVDVEAVDASGRRVPTFQQRVDFVTTGPAVWRGGYNSGKVDSIKHPFLDLEAGINRVALRSTREQGVVTLRASSEGLTPATLSIKTVESHGPERPVYPPLPASPQRQRGGPVRAPAGEATVQRGDAGRFTRSFNYTGPNAMIVHLETGAADGRNAYVDRDIRFENLPAGLRGADWIKTADGDSAYSAVDLIELAVKANCVVTIAHDASLTPPAWLDGQFVFSGENLPLGGRPMKLWRRNIAAAASLTLGSNNDGVKSTAALHYLIFINSAQP